MALKNEIERLGPNGPKRGRKNERKRTHDGRQGAGAEEVEAEEGFRLKVREGATQGASRARGFERWQATASKHKEQLPAGTLLHRQRA